MNNLENGGGSMIHSKERVNVLMLPLSFQGTLFTFLFYTHTHTHTHTHTPHTHIYIHT